jgi:hypothetical protein
VLCPSLSVLVERFARQLAVLTGSCGRLRGEPGVGGCEMPHADELERRDPLGVSELRSSRRFGSLLASSCSRTWSSRAWRSAVNVVDQRRLFVRQWPR